MPRSALHTSYTSATSSDSIERFVTSWILPPSALFFTRTLISFYAFVVLFISLAHDSSSIYAGRSFSYFTVLGYWGLGFYFAFSAAHTGAYWIRGRAWLEDWPKWLQYAHSCFYSSVTTFPFVVTVVFWTVLSQGALADRYETWSNISEHVLNSVFAFFELVVIRANPSPWINLVVVIVLLALYLTLAEITHATQGWYVYGFLNPHWLGRGGVAGACMVILAGTAISFTLARYLALLRKWLTENICRLDVRASNRGDARVQDLRGFDVLSSGRAEEIEGGGGFGGGDEGGVMLQVVHQKSASHETRQVPMGAHGV